MLKKIISGIILATSVLFTSSAHAEELDMEQAIEASCKVNSYSYTGTQMGSGVVFRENEDAYFIMTNGHVVNNGVRYTVQFFDEGYRSREISVTKSWERYVPRASIDIAILSLDKDKLNGYKPKIIPLADANVEIPKFTKVIGAGYPEGRWAQAWESRVLSYDDTRLSYFMPPVKGQSGSGVLAQIGDKVVVIGINTWRYSNGPRAYGAGVSAKHIHDAMNNNVRVKVVPTSYKELPTASTDENKRQVVTKNNPVCNTCGRPKLEHYYIRLDNGERKKDAKGNDLLHCPTCDKHDITHKEHLQKGWEESQICGPHGCFPRIIYPRPRPRPRPQRPDNPSPQQPNNPWQPNPNPNPTQPDNGDIFPDKPKPDNPDRPGTTPDEPNHDKCEKEKGELQDKVEQLDGRIANLQEKLDSMKNSRAALEGEKKVLRNKIDELEREKDKLLDENRSKERSLEQAQSQVEDLRQDKESLSSQIAQLSQSQQELEREKQKLLASNENHEERLAEIAQEKKKLAEDKARLEEQLQNADSNVEKPGRGGDSIKVIRDKHWLDDETGGYGNTVENTSFGVAGLLFGTLVVPFLKRKLGNMLGGLVAFGIQQAGGRVVRRFDDDDDEDNKKKVDSIPQGPSVQVNQYNSKDKIPNYFKEFFDHKENTTGESVETWAVYGVLYKEAVDELRKGKLYYKEGNRLQGQAKTADTLDAWVRHEFLQRTTIQDIKTKNALYNEAMFGFLYKEAVMKLRKGEFNVLGAKNTADAIQEWVEKEFIKREAW